MGVCMTQVSITVEYTTEENIFFSLVMHLSIVIPLYSSTRTHTHTRTHARTHAHTHIHSLSVTHTHSCIKTFESAKQWRRANTKSLCGQEKDCTKTSQGETHTQTHTHPTGELGRKNSEGHGHHDHRPSHRSNEVLSNTHVFKDTRFSSLRFVPRSPPGRPACSLHSLIYSFIHPFHPLPS